MRLAKEISVFEAGNNEGIKLVDRNSKGSIVAQIQGPLNTPW